MTTGADTLFKKAADAGASDVHIAVGSPAIFRIGGVLTPQGKTNLTKSNVEQVIRSCIGPANLKTLKEKKELDTSYALKSGIRLRINCHMERGNLGLVARIIPKTIPGLEEIHMQEIAEQLCALREGLILFTGPTGTGKSTTMASMIQHINSERTEHIVTIEDPIEFLFPKGKGLIRQRELGSDVLSFPEALKHVLRQDPNIILIGELRDLETIALALTAAETGHLVLATLHTPNAVQTVDRIIDVFPAHQQQQIRVQLSLSMKAIVAQRLVPCVHGGRIAQREVLVNTPAVANIIREARTAELASVIQTSSDAGMCTFEKHAKQLLKEDQIDKETYEWAKRGA